MENSNIQNQQSRKINLNTLLNGIGVLFIIPLLALFIFNLLLGYSGFSYQLLISPFAF